MRGIKFVKQSPPDAVGSATAPAQEKFFYWQHANITMEDLDSLDDTPFWILMPFKIKVSTWVRDELDSLSTLLQPF